jgi:hypothetical protein
MKRMRQRREDCDRLRQELDKSAGLLYQLPVVSTKKAINKRSKNEKTPRKERFLLKYKEDKDISSSLCDSFSDIAKI